MDILKDDIVVIENVLRSSIQGRIAYQGTIKSSFITKLTYSKKYDDPSGKGYQRPISYKHAKEFAQYLSLGESALYTPILLNAAGEWAFQIYDLDRPCIGRLICKSPATILDGQHRIEGIRYYTDETKANLNVPFLVFDCLDIDEEIKLFDIINTKARGLGKSLSRFLNRDYDDDS